MTVELLRSFLGWAAVCNIAFLCVLFVLYMAYRGTIYRLYFQMFGVQAETINAVLFGAMVFYDLSIFAFFIMPYLALRFFVTA